MTNDPASLGNLHGIVVPSPVPYWPPAAGWYVVGILLLSLGLAWLIHALLEYRRAAYRRAALVELKSATTMEEVATLLKRTAIAASSRDQVASLSGQDWMAWLADTSGLSLEEPVRQVLSSSLYGSSQPGDVSAVARFTGDWIRAHRCEQVPSRAEPAADEVQPPESSPC